MLQINISLLEKSVEDLRALLKDGLISTDVWDRETGLSLVGYNAQHEAVALFNQLTTELCATLDTAGFPALRSYYLLDLDGDNMVLILQHGKDLLQGLLMSSKKVNMGILFSIAIPRQLDAVIKARE